jgi:hypothetical protein
MDPASMYAIGTGANVLGGMMSARANRKMAKQQMWAQEKAARSQIRWRVADAKAAGINPLVALGASTTSMSPAMVGGGDPLGNAMQSMGQDISRAAMSNMDKTQRKITELNVEAAELRNEALREDIKNQKGMRISQQLGPGVQTDPLRRTASPAGKMHQEIGHVPDVGFAKTKTGLAPVPSSNVKEKIEDQMIPELSWAMRNQVMPNIGMGDKPSKKYLPKGAKDWQWSVNYQEWQPIRKKRPSTWGKVKQIGKGYFKHLLPYWQRKWKKGAK